MIAIRGEIARVAAGEWPVDDNPLRSAPHTAAALRRRVGRTPTPRELAAYPGGVAARATSTGRRSRRIDGAYGDRNLVCACPPPVCLRGLTAPGEPSPSPADGTVVKEIAALAALFDLYRAHYGQALRWRAPRAGSSRTSGPAVLHAFVAVDSSGFVGLAVAVEIPASLRLAHFWQVRDLYVLPAHRRQGIARSSSVRSGRLPPPRGRCASPCRPRRTTRRRSRSTSATATSR